MKIIRGGVQDRRGGPEDLGDSVSRARPGACGGGLVRLAAARRWRPGAVPGSGLMEAQRGFWGCSGDRLSAGLGETDRALEWFAP